MTTVAGMPIRVLACVAGAQLLGYAVGLAADGRDEIAWAGGALATFPGFLIGRVWHKGPLGRHGPLLWVLAIAMSAFAAVVKIPRTLLKARKIAELRSLNAADLKRLDIQDLGRLNSPTFSLSDDDALAGFVRACADAADHSPSHPSYARKWHVVLGGPRPMELELYLETRAPDVVVGAFVNKSGSTTRYHGNFQSRALRPWVARYLEKRD